MPATAHRSGLPARPRRPARGPTTSSSGPFAADRARFPGPGDTDHRALVVDLTLHAGR
ncbi:hypothetical protein ABZ368_25155 [Streptomyces sp. NPDC005908]|uniref:hypothetical protein n=1 Tax=unclassified Streptomyces TaxID=2593676 RepID=UPI0016468BDF|nr:hypothetical protein [Streptomyces sp. T12]